MLKERLKQLRTNAKLTQSELATNLGIGKTTLASYEQGKNEPNIETIIKIVNYFNVSTDYLFGLTDICSSDLKISYISKYLGLTERTINELHTYHTIAQKETENHTKQKIDTLNLFFTPYCELLEHITDYLNFSATHFKNFHDDSKKALAPIDELELWDDINQVGYSDDWDMWSKALLLIIEEELTRLRKDHLETRYNQLLNGTNTPTD